MRAQPKKETTGRLASVFLGMSYSCHVLLRQMLDFHLHVCIVLKEPRCMPSGGINSCIQESLRTKWNSGTSSGLKTVENWRWKPKTSWSADCCRWVVTSWRMTEMERTYLPWLLAPRTMDMKSRLSEKWAKAKSGELLVWIQSCIMSQWFSCDRAISQQQKAVGLIFRLERGQVILSEAVGQQLLDSVPLREPIEAELAQPATPAAATLSTPLSTATRGGESETSSSHKGTRKVRDSAKKSVSNESAKR